MGNRTVRISEERQKMMVDLYTSGMSRGKIAEQLGTGIETITKFLRLNGVELRPSFERRLSAADQQALIDRYKIGEKIPRLAADLGVTQHTIKKYLVAQGIPFRDDRGRARIFTETEYQQMRDMTAAGHSQKEIARALGSARSTIQGAMRSAGIPPARTGAASGPKHGGWTGGRMLRSDGYIEITLPVDHPLRPTSKRGGTMLEHRYVLAEKLGRALSPYETVHHINGIRSDNRPDNLQLRQGKHGKGAAFQCLDCGSHNVRAVTLAES